MLQKITALVLATSIMLAGCTVPEDTEAVETFQQDDPYYCSQYSFAVGYQEELHENMTQEELNSEFMVAFEQGLWKGFWDEHSNCEICRAAGRVPEEYLEP